MARVACRIWIPAALAAGLFLAAGQDSSAGKPDQPETKESRWPRVRLGGVFIGAGYSSGPWYGWPYGYYYGGGPWAYPGYLWDPFFYGAWAYPGFFTGYGYNPNFGEVKLTVSDKTGPVFINGGYAGVAGKLKSIWLEPGAYDIAVRSGSDEFRKRVYVLSGKTVKLHPQEERP